jgi:uncharacterized protein YndB with AHSA1/START domain
MNAGIKLSVHRVIAAPPEAAWELLTDLDAWPLWGPSIKGAELDPPYQELTLHATGVVQTSLVVKVPFVVTDFDAGRQWAWKVAGIPATGHRVDPVDGGSRVAMDVPLWATAYLTVCALALRRIEKLLVGVPG